MELGTLIRPHSSAESDVYASLGHVVQNCQILSQANRMPPGSDVRHLSDANRGRPRRKVRAEQDRIRDIAHSIGPKVVLTEPHRLEAEFLGQDGLLPEVVQQADGTRGFTGRGCDRRERGKSHACILRRRWETPDPQSYRRAVTDLPFPNDVDPSSAFSRPSIAQVNRSYRTRGRL